MLAHTQRVFCGTRFIGALAGDAVLILRDFSLLAAL